MKGNVGAISVLNFESRGVAIHHTQIYIYVYGQFIDIEQKFKDI